MSDHRLAAMDSYGSMNDDHFFATTYEADLETIDKRLKRLYPYVDFETTQVPTQWNRDDKCAFMRVSHLNLRFMYPDRPGEAIVPDRKNKVEPGAVRANHPVPLFAGVYYFEVHILESDGYMGLGLSQKSVKMNRLPGWDTLSYGYHGDDGHFFAASGQGAPYGPTFGTGDVIGCGLNLVRRTIFFTKNGENLGTAMEVMDSMDDLYPTVGLQTPRAMIDVNFGQKPFYYDIYKDINTMRTTLQLQVEEMRMPKFIKKEWLNGYIASWLATEGHANALKAFCEESKTEYDEIEEENVVERAELAKMVYERKVGALYEELESKYRVNDLRPLALDLRVQRYAERMFDIVEPVPLLTNGAAKAKAARNGAAAAARAASRAAPTAASAAAVPAPAPATTGEAAAAAAAAASVQTTSSSSISSAANGSGATATATVTATGIVCRPKVAKGAAAEAAKAAAAAAAAAAAGPSSSGLGTSSARGMLRAKSSSSIRGRLGGEAGPSTSTISPARPHKRRSSGAKVVPGQRREGSLSRPPSSDMGPPPRRRSAKGERRRESVGGGGGGWEDKMEVDNPEDLLKRVPMSKAPMRVVDSRGPPAAASSSSKKKNGSAAKAGGAARVGGARGAGPDAPCSSKSRQLTSDELRILTKGIGASSSNGNSRQASKNGHGSGRRKKEGPQIVKEATSRARSLRDHDEDIRKRGGYTKEEDAIAEARYGSILEEGKSICEEAKLLKRKHPILYRQAMDGLNTLLCNSKKELEEHEIFGEMRARCIVHAMNTGLIKLEYGNALCDSKLARLERSVRTQKAELMKNGCPIAPFVDIEGLLGREPEQFMRNKNGTASFYDPEHMRMLERRRKQAEIDEKMKRAREAKARAAKELKRRQMILMKRRMEKEKARMEIEGGGGEKQKKRKKKKKEPGEGGEGPPVLTEETPMEMEDGPCSSRGAVRPKEPSARGRKKGKSARKAAARAAAKAADMERLLLEGGEEGGGGAGEERVEEGGEPVGDAVARGDAGGAVL